MDVKVSELANSFLEIAQSGLRWKVSWCCIGLFLDNTTEFYLVAHIGYDYVVNIEREGWCHFHKLIVDL